MGSATPGPSCWPCSRKCWRSGRRQAPRCIPWGRPRTCCLISRATAVCSGKRTEVYELETAIWLQFLTGCALADRVTTAALGLTDQKVLDFLDKKAWDPEWESVLLPVMAKIKDPMPFMARLADPKADDEFLHRRALALKGMAAQGRSLQPGTPPAWADRLAALSEAIFRAYEEHVRHETSDAVPHLAEALEVGGAAIPTKGIEALTKRLRHSDKNVRRAASRAFAEMGAAMPEETIEVLTEMLQDPNADVRTAPVKALSAFGTEEGRIFRIRTRGAPASGWRGMWPASAP